MSRPFSVSVLALVLASAATLGACDDDGFKAAQDRRAAMNPSAAVSASGAKPAAANPATTPTADASANASAKANAKAEARAAKLAKKYATRAIIPANKLSSYSILPKEFAAEDNKTSPTKIALGRMLYYEKRLSKNHDISCNSCHLLDKFGVDNEATSPGHKGQRGDRNSPTVYNAAGHIAQFWDGRAATVEEQAKGPILNPVEMAMPDEKRVIATLESMPEYVKMFKAAFPGQPKPVTYDNMAKAIGVFERRLVTPGRFDKYLSGDSSALTDIEHAGFARFIELGCPTCHTGPAIGGTTYQKLGLVKEWPDQSDVGRFNITKDDSDKMKFRVPSLRNVAETGPYFHKGQVATLEEVVTLMARHQLGQELTEDDKFILVAFLNSLTGEIPTDYIKPPKLPESTDTTPKADPS